MPREATKLFLNLYSYIIKVLPNTSTNEWALATRDDSRVTTDPERVTTSKMRTYLYGKYEGDH